MSSRPLEISFRDVMCGFVCFDKPAESFESSFARALKEFEFFNGSRRIKKHADSSYVIYSNSAVEDSFNSPDLRAHFVGYASGLSHAKNRQRDLAQHFASLQSFKTEDLNGFIDSNFAGVLIDKAQRQVRLLTDYFGKRKLFYKIVGSVLYFATEFQVLVHVPDPEETLDRQALRTYLALGTPVGDRTLSAKIKSVPLHSYVEWDRSSLKLRDLEKPLADFNTSTGSRTSTGSNTLLNNIELDPQKVYSSFKSVIQFLTHDLNFHISDLTGGADSRMTLNALLEVGPPMIFTCENREQELSHIPYRYDLMVMEILRDKFSLKTQFDFEQYRSSQNFIDNKFATHRHFEGDMYNNGISSMYGGELMGGWAFDHFFDPIRVDHNQIFDEENLVTLPQGFFEGTKNFEEEISAECARIHYQDPQTLQSVVLTYASPSFFRDGQKPWFEAYQLTARKVSAFLGDAVLRSLDVLDSSTQLSSYKFYLKLYETCAPQMLEMPFNSGFSRIFPNKLKDIRDQVSIPKPPSQKEERSMLELRMSLLKDYFKYLQRPQGLAAIAEISF